MLVTAVSVLVGAAILYLGLTAAVAWFSVHPFRIPVFVAPRLMGLPQESFEVATADGLAIKGWWVPVEDACYVVVCCHGYMMNRCEFVPFAPLFASSGASCVFFDFRAHGWSAGDRSSFGVDERHDLLAVIEHVRALQPGLPIALFGASMGAAAAVRAAAELPDDVDALILDSPYERLDVAARGWWRYLDRGRWGRLLAPVTWFGGLMTGVDPAKVDTVDSLRSVAHIPTLFLLGSQDPLLPPASAKRLLEAAPSARQAWFTESGHTEARFHESERYIEEVFRYLEEIELCRPGRDNWIKHRPAGVE